MIVKLEITNEVRDRLEQMKEQRGLTSLTQVFQNALAIYEFIHREETYNKAKVSLVYPDGSERDMEVR